MSLGLDRNADIRVRASAVRDFAVSSLSPGKLTLFGRSDSFWYVIIHWTLPLGIMRHRTSSSYPFDVSVRACKQFIHPISTAREFGNQVNNYPYQVKPLKSNLVAHVLAGIIFDSDDRTFYPMKCDRILYECKYFHDASRNRFHVAKG